MGDERGNEYDRVRHDKDIISSFSFQADVSKPLFTGIPKCASKIARRQEERYRVFSDKQRGDYTTI
jgi:hypothetical protein